MQGNVREVVADQLTLYIVSKMLWLMPERMFLATKNVCIFDCLLEMLEKLPAILWKIRNFSLKSKLFLVGNNLKKKYQ